MAGVIYGAFYVKGKVNVREVKTWENNQLGSKRYDEAFVEELSAHNQTPEGVDALWRVYALDQQGNAFVEKNGEVRHLLPNSYDMANPAETALNVNTMVNIKRPKEHRKMQPTFYHVNSKSPDANGRRNRAFFTGISNRKEPSTWSNTSPGLLTVTRCHLCLNVPTTLKAIPGPMELCSIFCVSNFALPVCSCEK